MIRGTGEKESSTYSQTLNRYEIKNKYLSDLWMKIRAASSGPFLVSRTGDVG